MRTAIYGAGSLGTVLGAYLTKGGADVELVNRNRDHINALKEHGARVTGTVEMTVPVKAIFPEEMSGEYDVIFLLTKQTDNRSVASFLKPYLSDKGVICTMQNGLPEPALAEVVGEERVIGCTVAWGAMLKEPGVSMLTSSPDSLTFGMGSINGKKSDQFLAVKSLLEMMCPVEVEDNLAGVRWSKLLVNAAFSGVGTVIGGTYGDVVDNRAARKIALGVMKECIDVGHASGVVFAPVQGKDIVKLFYYKNPFKKMVSLMLIPIAMKKHRLVKPSMLQDIEREKPCEIAAINGVICAYGRRYDVPTPFNGRIEEIVNKEQSGELRPCSDNIRLFKNLQ